jgi:cytolysin-activating lysine-acyltransferase
VAGPVGTDAVLPSDHGQLQLDQASQGKLASVRAKIHETLSKVALAMASTPRYRHLPIGDLTSLVLDPLLRDRIAIASAVSADGKANETDIAGIAIWASVSEAVDAKISEQVKAGVFPVRLQPEDWASGRISWLLDVIAPNARLATSVLVNFRQVTNDGELRIHPVVSKLIDPQVLKKVTAHDRRKLF